MAAKAAAWRGAGGAGLLRKGGGCPGGALRGKIRQDLSYRQQGESAAFGGVCPCLGRPSAHGQGVLGAAGGFASSPDAQGPACCSGTLFQLYFCCLLDHFPPASVILPTGCADIKWL